MEEEKIKKIITLIFIIIFLGTSVYFITYTPSNNTKEVKNNEILKNSESKTKELKEETIVVDIKGEVNNPGIYEVPSNTRIMDVINAAGGLTTFADTNNINLSKIVEDEMVIIIESVNEESNDYTINNDGAINPSDALGSSGDKPSSSLISLNRASKEELMTLSGIGESKADAIIEYRNKTGGFKKIEELMEVSGIGEATFNKIKDNITI